MLTEDNAMVAIYGEFDGDVDRLHLVVNSANAIHYSIKLDVAELDSALSMMCRIGAVVSRVDAGEAEMYDGNLDADPDRESVDQCVQFARWARRRDLRCHGDVFEYFE
jgi:hypothetical protein